MDMSVIKYVTALLLRQEEHYLLVLLQVLSEQSW